MQILLDKLAFLFLLIIPVYSFALDLTTPFYFENAMVLPLGVRNPRFLVALISADSKFSGSGILEPLAKPLNQDLKWKTILKNLEDETQKKLIQSFLKVAEIDQEGGVGSITGQISSFSSAKIPAFAIGITDRLTFALGVPIISVSVNADVGFVKSKDGQKFIDQLSRFSEEKAHQAAQELNTSLNKKLSEYGYQSICNQNFTEIGDIQIHGKYLLFQDFQNRLSWKLTFVLPTGNSPHPDRLINIPTGDGAFQVGTSLFYDRSLPCNFVWTGWGGVLTRLPHSIEKRIPINASEPISRDKETLTMLMGNTATLGTSLQHYFPKLGLFTGLSYTFQAMSKTRYANGSFYSSERYDYLNNSSFSQILHGIGIMAGFSSIEWFQKKKFFYPFQANLVWGYPIFGKNAAAANVVSGELVLFF